MTENESLLVLNAVPNLDAVRIRKLVKFFGSALRALESSPKDLHASGTLLADHVKNIINFSKDKFIQREYNLMQQKSLSVITMADHAYPCSLKELDNAPVVLYIKGDARLLKENSVAMVGSRAASYYGRQSGRIFAKAFAQAGLIVVSGLARGIDTVCHQGALEAGGKTIAVIGCGFDYVYPKENQSLMQTISQQGAVVSEYACHMPPLQHNFPWRNRIISALSLATVVVEAGQRSGALITADFALAQNKDVFVLPANIDTETALGSNQLIRDGAMVSLSPEDVLSYLRPGFWANANSKTKPPLLLSDEQAKIYPFINTEPVHVDQLAKQSGLNIASLMNITLKLELKHLIRQLPGQYYVRIAEDA